MSLTNEEGVPTKLLWVDLEMTGLDPQKQKILEVASVITDFNFLVLGKYEAVIHQPPEVLAGAEPWVLANMQELFAESRSSQKSEAQVATEFEQFIRQHFDMERAIMAGNSIHQDRRFVRRWWPRVEELLHYRMFDVSTLKIYIQGTSNFEFIKTDDHRAEGDVIESIGEAKWALERIRTSKPPVAN